MMHALAGISLLLYVLFLLVCVRALLRQSTRLKALAIGIEIAALVFQVALLLFPGEGGFKLDWSDLLFKISVGLIVTDLLVRLRYSYPIISFILVTMSLITFVSSSILMHLSAQVDALSSGSLYLVHVIPAVSSLFLQLCVLAAAASLIYFSRALKSKNAKVLFLPNPGLVKLAEWLRLSLILSCLAWTVTLLSGGLYSLLRQLSFFSGGLVNTLSIWSWLLSTMLFYLAVSKKVKNLALARYSLLFSVLVVLLFIGLSFFSGNIIHSFTDH